jgi:hypothetical protein
MLDTTSAPNHTSEEQLKSWQATINISLVDTYNACPLGQVNPIDNDEFVTFIKAVGCDHANDQKKWGRLTNDWTTLSHKIMLGKKYLSSNELQAYLPEITRRNDAKILDAGGLDAWNALSEDEKTRRDIAVIYCRSYSIPELIFLRFAMTFERNSAKESGRISLHRSESTRNHWCGVDVACTRK